MIGCFLEQLRYACSDLFANVDGRFYRLFKLFFVAQLFVFAQQLGKTCYLDGFVAQIKYVEIQIFEHLLCLVGHFRLQRLYNGKFDIYIVESGILNSITHGIKINHCLLQIFNIHHTHRLAYAIEYSSFGDFCIRFCHYQTETFKHHLAYVRFVLMVGKPELKEV